MNNFLYLAMYILFLIFFYTVRCCLDFGCANSLGVTPHPLYLKVTNDTTIPTRLVATVTHFPSGLMQDDQLMESDGNRLLSLTANLANPKSMSDKATQSG